MRYTALASLSVLMYCSGAIAQTTETVDVVSTRSATVRDSKVTTAGFEKRWEREEALYREAGVPDENIVKLRELMQRQFETQRSGQKVDYRAIMTERQKLVTPEQLEKMKSISMKRVQQRTESAGSVTSGPAGEVK